MTQIALNGIVLNYMEIGVGKEAPLLILHGWGRSGGEWINIAQELSQWSGRKAYILDLPGFGGSSLPKIADIFEYSQFVVDFCEYLEISKVVLIGHSLGGRVGIVMASKHSQLVEKLVLVDPAGVKPKSLKRSVLKTFAKVFFWIPKNIKSKVLGKVMDEDYRSSPTLRELYRSIVKDDLKNILSKIKCETIVVWGERDRVLPVALVKIYRDKLSKHTIRLVWGADHDPHLTQYDQTLKILQEAVE